MRKHWMGLAAAIVLAAGAGLSSPAQSVERGGRAASTFVTVSALLEPNDEYAMVCGFKTFPRTAFLMVTDHFSPTDGIDGFKGAARYSGSDSELRVTGKVSKFRFDQYPPEDNPPYPGVFGSVGVATKAGTLVKSLASWTAAGNCTFTVNGVEKPLTVIDNSLARVIDLAEFDGGASVQVDPLITAGALQSRTQTSGGHLTAILDVSSNTGSSALLKVAGPEGQSYEALSFNPLVWIDEAQTSGDWTYEVSGVQSSPQFPVLWIMEKPSA